uniref:BG antigen n=1 Tax=Gallus gallus TaxID=9031 RepID=B5BSA9_CHICK|nr:BG antigen [Gallus gallus]
MHFLLGCNHPSFTLPWRTLLPYLVALHLLQLGSAQLRVVAPSLRVTANVGQDVVLRCQLSPCKDAWSSDIRWIQHRTSGFVHHYQNGEDLEQMEEYKGRTELLRDGLSDGNLDLRITAVSTSDSGSYSCAVQDGDGYADAVVDLEVSDPFSQITHPWIVALALVVTLLIASFVIIVFLCRKKAETTKQKGKDAELERMDAKLGTLAAELERRDAKLETLVENLERRNAEFAEKLASDLERRDAKLETLVESLERRNAEFAEKLASDLERRNAQLDKLASDLVQQTKAVGQRYTKSDYPQYPNQRGVGPAHAGRMGPI